MGRCEFVLQKKKVWAAYRNFMIFRWYLAQEVTGKLDKLYGVLGNCFKDFLKSPRERM